MIFGGSGFLSVGASSASSESDPSSYPALSKSHGLSAALFAFPFAELDPVYLPFGADDRAAGYSILCFLKAATGTHYESALVNTGKGFIGPSKYSHSPWARWSPSLFLFCISTLQYRQMKGTSCLPSLRCFPDRGSIALQHRLHLMRLASNSICV
jgi:hypothetical protein